MKFCCLFVLLTGLGLPGMAATVVESCAVCGEPLPETVYLVPDQVAGEKKKICGECAALTQICYLCGLPVKRDFTKLSDGRILCARDAKSVILDDEEAKKICHEAKEALDRQFSRFISFPDTNLSIAIADRVSLLEFFKMPGNDYECPNVMGYIQTHTNHGQLQHQISVMSGLLPGVLRSTFTHECTHAWIAENVSDARKARLSRDTAEGFCELVAYLTMGSLGDTKTQELITKNTYTRGQAGLLIEAEQSYGFNEVVDWIKQGEDSRLKAGEVDRVRQLAKIPTTTPSRSIIQTSSTSPIPPPPPPSTLQLQGITWAGVRSLAAINNHNFANGESAKMNLGGTNVLVRYLEIRKDAVVIQRAGADATEELRLPRKP